MTYFYEGKTELELVALATEDVTNVIYNYLEDVKVLNEDIQELEAENTELRDLASIYLGRILELSAKLKEQNGG